MTLAESLCKCSMNDGISQSELESGVSHVAGIGKTPVVFGLGGFPAGVGVPVPHLWLSKTG